MTDRMDTEALQALVARGNIVPDSSTNQGTLDAAAAAPALAAEVLKLRAMREAAEAVISRVEEARADEGVDCGTVAGAWLLTDPMTEALELFRSIAKKEA